eukprot:Mrub_05557.p1 GENE.Mrub_05557~~Mrub_05557.p1  ORF type:complete len:319 (+),score=31.57 Mrub_05557:84-959(+)
MQNKVMNLIYEQQYDLFDSIISSGLINTMIHVIIAINFNTFEYIIENNLTYWIKTYIKIYIALNLILLDKNVLKRLNISNQTQMLINNVIIVTKIKVKKYLKENKDVISDSFEPILNAVLSENYATIDWRKVYNMSKISFTSHVKDQVELIMCVGYHLRILKPQQRSFSVSSIPNPQMFNDNHNHTNNNIHNSVINNSSQRNHQSLYRRSESTTNNTIILQNVIKNPNDNANLNPNSAKKGNQMMSYDRSTNWTFSDERFRLFGSDERGNDVIDVNSHKYSAFNQEFNPDY